MRRCICLGEQWAKLRLLPMRIRTRTRTRILTDIPMTLFRRTRTQERAEARVQWICSRWTAPPSTTMRLRIPLRASQNTAL